jgi:hypothetical protein
MLNLVLPGGYKIKILIFETANHETFLDTKIFSSTPNCVGVVFVVFNFWSKDSQNLQNQNQSTFQNQNQNQIQNYSNILLLILRF